MATSGGLYWIKFHLTVSVYYKCAILTLLSLYKTSLYSLTPFNGSLLLFSHSELLSQWVSNRETKRMTRVQTEIWSRRTTMDSFLGFLFSVSLFQARRRDSMLLIIILLLLFLLDSWYSLSFSQIFPDFSVPSFFCFLFRKSQWRKLMNDYKKSLFYIRLNIFK